MFDNQYIPPRVRTNIYDLFDDVSTKVYFAIIVFMLLLAIFGPHLAPYNAGEAHYQDGELRSFESPSYDHWLGTNDRGQDILSRMLVGARTTVLAGTIGGATLIGIGLGIGLVSGYHGGIIDDILMRFTDFAYGVPIFPFAIIIIPIFGTGYLLSAFIIGLILWRGLARVVRSQTLQIKERPFIQSAKAMGASDTRIILKYILPSVIPMALLFFAIGIGLTILFMAGLAFLGVASPTQPDWGLILRNAFQSGWVDKALWWSVPPSMMIALIVLSTLMFGRKLEITFTGSESVGIARS